MWYLTEARRARKFESFAAWLNGFMTASNIYATDTWDITANTDLNGMLGWVDNWCKSHPTEKFAAAVTELSAYLYPSRSKNDRPGPKPN